MNHQKFTAQVPEFTNPNGVPDWRLTEQEAGLWLLSQQQRRAGATVQYDSEIGRWKPKGAISPTVLSVACNQCGAHFEAKRRTAKWCSKRCENRAHNGSVRS